MNNRRVASFFLAVYSAFTAGIDGMGGGGRYHVKPVKKTRMKGMSAKEMGTSGKKKKSRAQRKSNRRRNIKEANYGKHKSI